MKGELNDMQVRNVLSSQVVGRLACTEGKRPYIVPVTFTFDGEYIYGQTNLGRKLKMLRKNPNVCFEVDMMTDMTNWQSVLVYGKFEELKKEKAKKGRDILFDRVFSLMTSSAVHPHEHTVTSKPLNSGRIKPVMYRIKIKKITGRFEET